MKKIWLIAFVFNMLIFFLPAIDLTPPVFGIKAGFDFAEGVFYVKEDSVTYGLSLFTKEIFPALNMTFKIGKLSAAGGYSKLNSPALSSSVSAFSSSVSSASGITVSLPGSTSFSKALSLFCEYEYRKKKSPHENRTDQKGFIQNIRLESIKINTFLIPSFDSQNKIIENAAASILAKIKTSKKTNLTAAYTAGLFFLEENIKTAWFFNEKNDRFYHEQNLFCQNLQLGFLSSAYSNTSIFSVYQSPFGKLDLCVRSENLIKLNKTSINFAGFYATEDFLSGNQKNINAQLQAKAGLHHTFIKCISHADKVIPLFINTGFNSYIQSDFTDILNLKGSAGIRCTSDYFTLSATAAFTGTYQSEYGQAGSNPFTISSWSIQTKEIFLIKAFKPTLTQSFSFSPSPEKEKRTSSQKLLITWIFPKNPYLSGNLGLSLSQKNGIMENKELSFGISASYSWKKIKILAKVNGKIL